jgi:hypothetical protein
VTNAINNLLNGIIGSIVGSILGVIGAYYLAVRTIRKTLQNDRALTRERVGVEAAGTIAVNLVTFYDLLGELVRNSSDKPVSASIYIEPQFGEELTKTMQLLNRDITIEATLLPQPLAQNVGHARKAMREVLGVSTKSTILKSELLELRQIIRDTGDHLREYRRNSYSI